MRGSTIGSDQLKILLALMFLRYRDILSQLCIEDGNPQASNRE